MNQTQARCNRIARRSGEHCHAYPQLMLGWRGTMDYEFGPGGERLVLGQAAILPPGESHLYLGRDDDCEVLVLDIDAEDPCLEALERCCTLELRDSLFAAPRTLNLPPTLIPMVEMAAHQLKAPRTQAQTALLNHQLGMLFVSQSQLHLRCLRDFGVTPQQYVMNRRLSWARYWLRETPRSVSEIAFDLGFAEVSSFSRAYRRRVGRAPSEERKSR